MFETSLDESLLVGNRVVFMEGDVLEEWDIFEPISSVKSAYSSYI